MRQSKDRRTREEPGSGKITARIKWLGIGMACAGLIGVIWLYFFASAPSGDRSAAKALFEQGNAHLNVGQVGRAMDYYKQAIDRDPDFVYAYNGMGMAYRATGDLARAESYLLQALSLDRTVVDTYNNPGDHLFGERQGGEGRSHIQAGSRLGPELGRDALQSRCLLRADRPVQQGGERVQESRPTQTGPIPSPQQPSTFLHRLGQAAGGYSGVRRSRSS